jgi:hypothetical protein
MAMQWTDMRRNGSRTEASPIRRPTPTAPGVTPFVTGMKGTWLRSTISTEPA